MDRIDFSKFHPLADALEGTNFDELVLAANNWWQKPTKNEIAQGIIAAGETSLEYASDPAKRAELAQKVANHIVAIRTPMV